MKGEPGLHNAGPGPARRVAATARVARDPAADQPGSGNQETGNQETGNQRLGKLGTGKQRTAGQNTAGQNTSGMDEPNGSGRPRSTGAEMPDLGKLAQDWVTLWQSELAAMAADPEIRESWQTMVALWAGTMAATLRTPPRDPRASAHDCPPGGSASADAPRTTPAAAAPDARDAEIKRLARHVTALERRLAELERGGDPAVDPKRRPGRKQHR